MPSFFSIFGKTPALSAAEMLAIFMRENMEVKIRRMSSSGAIFEAARPALPGRSGLDAAFWSQLGGTVKAGEIIDTLQLPTSVLLPAFPPPLTPPLPPLLTSPQAGEEIMNTLLPLLCRDIWERVPEGKMRFGISVYDLEIGGWRLEVGDLGKSLKKVLVDEGRSARHVTSREKNLSAVAIRKNGLLGPGVEYCIFADKEQVAIGVTAWVHEYEEFAFREFARPRANAVSGMLPVKLARMLVNLAGVPRSATILDPFCGSGTIVAEALTLGYENVFASDLEKSAVEQTRENIRWMRERLNMPGAIDILQSPAEKIHEALRDKTADAIVTEPYLGPPLRGGESAEKIDAIQTELATIYRNAFLSFAQLLKPGAPVVFVLPVLLKKKKFLFLDILADIEKAGFRAEPLVPERFAHTPGFAITPRGGVIYSRPDQRVQREIFRFRRM